MDNQLHFFQSLKDGESYGCEYYTVDRASPWFSYLPMK